MQNNNTASYNLYTRKLDYLAVDLKNNLAFWTKKIVEIHCVSQISTRLTCINLRMVIEF